MRRIASETPNMIMGMFGGFGQSVGTKKIILRRWYNQHFDKHLSLSFPTIFFSSRGENSNTFCFAEKIFLNELLVEG